MIRTDSARVAWLAFAVTLILYLATMSRGLGFMDRGELSAAAVTFGIGHPTGYPTLLLVGGLLTHVLPLRPILVLNGLAALLAAAGVGVLTLLLDRVLASLDPVMRKRSRAIYALLAALFAGTTITWWQQANGFEVYSLHVLLVSILLLRFLDWTDRAAADGPDVDSKATVRAGRWFAFVVGLSFTNHMTTALLAPGLLIAAGMRFGSVHVLIRRCVGLVPAFLLPLAIYLWLPLRSAMQPRFDWGNPETLGAFMRHVAGAQYRGMLLDPERMSLQWRYLVWRVPGDYAWVGVLVAAIGALVLLRRTPTLAALSLGFAAVGATFAITYGVPDPDPYLFTGLMGALLCFVAGLARVHQRFGARVAVPLASALVLLNAGLHWKECDESHTQLTESFIRDAIGPLPERAVLFTKMWETLDSGSHYLQEVEGFRRDVVVVNPDQMFSTWYLSELEHRAPELMQRIEPERDAYVTLEGDPTQTLARIDSARAVMVRALVAAAMEDRPVFSTGALSEVRDRYRRVPWHLALWLRSDTAYVPQPEWKLAFRPWKGKLDLASSTVCRAYAEARVERARYESAHGRVGEARRLVRDLARFDPGVRPDQVAPQPLGFDRWVLISLAFFRDLEASDPLAAAP